MKQLLRLCGVLLLLTCLPTAWAQTAASKIARIDIKHLGPAAVSDALIRSNIRVKVGDAYQPLAVDDDVRNLYATGFFYNIHVSSEITGEGVVLTYAVQGKPRLTDIKFQGNKKYSASKLRKKLTSKVGEPLDERKLFTDSQEIQKKYQKAGYPRTEVKAYSTVIEESGRATANFEINESPKVKIIEVDFVGAQAFPQKKLRKVIKTRKHWMFSWLTGSGKLKDEQFEDDKERLGEFYRDNGYIDFEIKDVQFLNPTPRTMIIRFVIYEGRQYKVGGVKFTGNKLFSTGDLTNGMRVLQHQHKVKTGPNGLPMDVGDTFRPKGMAQDVEAVEDFYGARGYIDVTSASHNLTVLRVPNTDRGTMDLEFQIEEGQKSFIERIEIRGNTKTKDKVIRRELAVAPGEVFDMVRVKLSRQRLEGLQYFEKVDARPEPTTVPSRKNLVIGVDEKNTGNMMVGAGFSTVDSIVGYAEVSQGNFDLFHPPTFTGGGQKFRLRVQVGTERQDYLMGFVEPWFLGRKLALSVDLYYHDWNYQSPNDLYHEIRYGTRFGLERTLWSDFIRGSVSYTLENVGIKLNETPRPDSSQNCTNIPQAILKEVGYSLLSRFGGALAYDTRNSTQLPDKGQRTELFGEFVSGEREFYKLQLSSSWFFKGFAKGHVLEIHGRTGVADGFGAEDVPFYERYYLGGMYSLRGFKYRNISPRQMDPRINEPIGGDTFWFGSIEYSIPIIERLRFAMFYDIGNVAANSYSWTFSDFSDNWGVGLRLNLPIGPLRLDYGIPINHDQFNSSSGKFQFGVGWERPF